MLSKSEVQLMARMQLAKDLACSPRDFTRPSNTVMPFQVQEGRRPFQEREFLYVACFGRGAVFSVDPLIQGAVEEAAARRKGPEWFEHGTMRELDRILEPHGWEMGDVHLAYLPEFLLRRADSGLAPVRWFEGAAVRQLYENPSFPNALTYRPDSFRPDVLAVASCDEKGEITGLAGASADSRKFWQIGIDVLPGNRREGLGSYLVNLLTAEIIRRGVIPYYATQAGNIASQSIARKCGYYPAWVEMHASPISEK